MRWWSGLLALLLAGAGFAQTDSQRVPQGVPQVATMVADAEFGVSTRQLGLQRHVEMYQWRKNDTLRGSGVQYDRGWSSVRIDSNTYAAGHDNPVEFPLVRHEWIADDIRLDNKPLAPQVLEELGKWRDYRPDFSALPGNLSATFQPEGDGLGSAINPLDPQIGDLRITWRELVLPPLKGAVAMNNGVWTMAQAQPAGSETLMTAGASDADYSKKEVAGFVGAGLFVLLLIVLVIYMKKRRR